HPTSVQTANTTISGKASVLRREKRFFPTVRGSRPGTHLRPTFSQQDFAPEYTLLSTIRLQPSSLPLLSSLPLFA
ncbi:MAG TPA: hypothetical protein VFG04_05115, partial [Planctomycetaceae bacterium]|nr:hypothetical protein [Planctomycetaceae bacterium]